MVFMFYAQTITYNKLIYYILYDGNFSGLGYLPSFFLIYTYRSMAVAYISTRQLTSTHNQHPNVWEMVTIQSSVSRYVCYNITQ